MARRTKEPVTKIVRREYDLSPPIQEYLAAQGYTVRCEVNGCDITATLGGELIVVELKKQFSTDLLIQAIDRQRSADSVYIALPSEAATERRRQYIKRRRGIERLLKRLELGLILVHFPVERNGPPTVEVALHPICETRPKKSLRVRKTILREIAGREAGNHNLGGVNKRGILTTYREQAIFIACCLARSGPLSPAKLRRLYGTCEKTQVILHGNPYGWFDRIDRGTYSVRPGVLESIASSYTAAVAFYEQKVSDAAFTEAPSGGDVV